jgi:hypothetical protein
MKWYSLKKYIPPFDTICFLKAENDYFYIGWLRHGDPLTRWNNEDDDYTPIGPDITHFCIPAPVEVEE